MFVFIIQFIYLRAWQQPIMAKIIIIQFNSILYFNVLTQQLQEPVTESAQEDKYIHSKEINIKMRTKLN
jgi:hypothetical protein